jgi:predicted small lipoprotein YifL
MRILILAAALAVALSACGRHNDGMGDLYKGVRCVETNRC